MSLILGVEIGGTKLQVGVGDERGRIRQLTRAAVDRSGGRAGILRQLEQAIPELLARHSVRAIGVGFGGPVDAARGCVVKSHQVVGWSGFRLRHWFEKRFSLPTVLENDSNCAALAEAVRGAGRGKARVLYFNVGTGIGGGLVVAGRLDGGRYGGSELGHTRLRVNGRYPIVEAVASGLAIERGVSTVAQSARHLGFAVANAITLMNPDIVVVGGGVALAGRRFFEPLRATVDRFVFPVYRANFRIVPAALGETVVVVGALLSAKTGLSS